MNRCRECNSICPDFSDVCDTCNYIEEEMREDDELEIEDEEDEN